MTVFTPAFVVALQRQLESTPPPEESPARDFLGEARAILDDQPPAGYVSLVIPERAHLLALSEHYLELLHELTTHIRELKAGYAARSHRLNATTVGTSRCAPGGESRS
jgi:hypothetical protein